MKNKVVLKLLSVVFAVVGFASMGFSGQELLPIPDPGPSVVRQEPAVTVTTCQGPTDAVVYTVKSRRDQCGRPVAPRHACIVGQAFAPVRPCEDCGSVSRAEEIRCKSRDCGVCEDAEYLDALVGDLTSRSLFVRRAAARSLEKCGYEVHQSRPQCVTVPVPSYSSTFIKIN